MPDLIPSYVENNYDQLDTKTITKHVDYLTRTRRDVQFLLNVIEQERKHPKSEYTLKPKKINSTFITPDKDFNDNVQSFQPYKHASRTKYLKFLRDQTKKSTFTEHFENQYSNANFSSNSHQRHTTC